MVGHLQGSSWRFPPDVLILLCHMSTEMALHIVPKALPNDMGAPCRGSKDWLYLFRQKGNLAPNGGISPPKVMQPICGGAGNRCPVSSAQKGPGGTSNLRGGPPPALMFLDALIL